MIANLKNAYGYLEVQFASFHSSLHSKRSLFPVHISGLLIHVETTVSCYSFLQLLSVSVLLFKIMMWDIYISSCTILVDVLCTFCCGNHVLL